MAIYKTILKQNELQTIENISYNKNYILYGIFFKLFSSILIFLINYIKKDTR